MAVQDPIAPIRLADVAAGVGGFKIRGEAGADLAGVSVNGAGDVNGDGRADLLVGARQNDAGGLSSGAAYVVFGKAGGPPVDLAAVAAGTGGFKIGGEASFDRAGTSVAGVGDLNSDGLADVLVGAPDASGAGAGNGAAYVVFGKAGGAQVDLAAVAAGAGGFKIRSGELDNDVGEAVAAAGDVNGDGTPDLLVGDPDSEAAGAAYVVFGNAGGAPVDLATVAAGAGGGFRIVGEDSGDAGASVAAAGDLNGDGLADVIVGDLFADGGEFTDNGAAYVVFGKTGGAPVDLAAVAAGAGGGFKITGEPISFERAGFSVAGVGDVNGDGVADLALGANVSDIGGVRDRGATYVVFGKADTDEVLLDEVGAGRGGFQILGEAAEDRSGASVAAAGDLNGDGLADLIIGANATFGVGASAAGFAFVVFGKRDTAEVDLADIALGIGGFKIIGEAADDAAGISVSAAGDVNGDGLDDLLIGAETNDSTGFFGNGAAYVVYGSVDWLA